MEGKQPSRTARSVAGLRAAHQLADKAAVFKDDFARPLLDEEALAEADENSRHPEGKSFRFFIAARSRFAEDCIAADVARGLRQVVILGAGLDTFGLRNPYRDLGLHVYEVDHPATQIWKRERLAAARIEVPADITFVPVDFERDDLTRTLAGNGFRQEDPVLYVWLGVVPYLRRETVFALLRSVGAGTDAGIVFDYSEPLENYAPERRARAEAMAAAVASLGEPWVTLLDPVDLAATLRSLGFRHIEDLGPSKIATRYFGRPAAAPGSEAGPHILFASTRTEPVEVQATGPQG